MFWVLQGGAIVPSLITNLGDQELSLSGLSALSNLACIWLNLPGTTALVRIALGMIH